MNNKNVSMFACSISINHLSAFLYIFSSNSKIIKQPKSTHWMLDSNCIKGTWEGCWNRAGINVLLYSSLFFFFLCYLLARFAFFFIASITQVHCPNNKQNAMNLIFHFFFVFVTFFYAQLPTAKTRNGILGFLLNLILLILC